MDRPVFSLAHCIPSANICIKTAVGKRKIRIESANLVLSSNGLAIEKRPRKMAPVWRSKADGCALILKNYEPKIEELWWEGEEDEDLSDLREAVSERFSVLSD